MKDTPILKTSRLFLRGITEADTKIIVQMRSKPEVYRYFVSPHEITAEEHIKWFNNNYVFNENRIDWIAFDFYENAVGVFGVKRDSKISGEAEVSYILVPSSYGKGYAAEAVNRLIQFCKEEWKCVSVIAEVHENNLNSIRFAERLGFEFCMKSGKFIQYRKLI